jgi:hypothetical protein
MEEPKSILVKVSKIRSIQVGLFGAPFISLDEPPRLAWLLTQELNPELAQAMVNTPPDASMTGFSRSSAEDASQKAIEIRETDFSDCDLVIQTGWKIARRTGTQLEGLLATYIKSERKRPTVMVGGNLTLIPA